MVNTETSVHTTIPRFTVQDGYDVLFMDVLDTGRLAVAGSNNGKKNTFIDLFMFHVNPDSQEKPLSLTPEPYFSQEFTEFGSSWRSVCLLDDRLFLTCCKDTIALYDSSNGGLVKQGKFNGVAWCMTSRGGLVYVGLRYSHEVIVSDARELRIKKTIVLKGLRLGDWPNDITVSNNKLFICTGYRSALMCNSEGEIEQEYTHTQYRDALSVTVSEEKVLIFILWECGEGSRVVVYSLSGGHSSISGGHSSISGGHILASFKVPNNSRRIRINNNINRLFLVTQTTGEVYEYHTSDIFTFDNLLMCSESFIEKDVCQKLLDYFEVPAKESEDIIESDAPFSSVIHHLTEAEKVSVDDISHLMTACSDKGLSNLVAVLTACQQAQDSKLTKKVLKDQLKALEDKRQELSHKLPESEDEKQQLTGRLKTTEEEREHFRIRLNTTENKLKTLKDGKDELLQQQKEELEDAKSSLRATKDELVKSRLEHIKESMALQEVMKQTKEALKQELEDAKSSLRATKDELVKSQLEHIKESMALQEVMKQTKEALKQASSASFTEEETLLEEHEPLDVSQQLTLAADYGRLMVNVADDLTLDSTLKLATLFSLPPAETDMLRRVSLIETPGITLINFMKTRNIINMYDVTNLQKGLVYIQLNQTNENRLAPYQSKVDPFQFEENQAPELLEWPVENVSFVPDDKSTPSQCSDKREENHDRSKENLMERTEREELPKQRKDSQILEMRHHHSYIEHRIKCEGGTISIMGVHLTFPEDALSFDHVIAVKVIYDPDIHLPGSARRGRMTPLIKLEPEGLILNKPAQLTIPHLAIIPEPDRHNVIIFTGLKDEKHLQEGETTWTEEKSIDWKLDPEKISLDINILSFVFVNLVSQETEQKHIFRVVPFIDGILDAKDDVLITVCFCKDSDEEYKLLLEDHQSKLSLGNYTTFQVTRTMNDDRDSASYIDMMMTSPGDSYHLMKKESTKHVDIDHLCAASRVSHQFRLNRNNDEDTDMVDVKLKVSQHEKNQTALILQSKVKNILLSPETQEILFRELHPDLPTYEQLRGDIAKHLEKKHCKKLGVYFKLTPVENETIQTAAESGKMLMKILDERELIMPDRMIGMYEGLKAIDFNKVASLVLEYIGTSQEKTGKENEGEKDDKKMVNIPVKQEVISKREPKLSVNFKMLIEEGYKRLDVQRALKLSHGKLDLGRRILLLAKEEHERLPLFPGSNLYKEQYFDQHGGEMVIAGVILHVPAGALHTGRIVSLWVSADPAIKGPISKKSLRLTPFVKFGPESLTLHKHVTLIIPHCAFTPADQMGIDVYSGVLKTDKSVKWSLERKHLSCSMNSQHFAVEAEKPCLIGFHVPFIPKMWKRICVLPIVNIVSESGDQLTIHLWFHNDDALERESLINEIYQQKGTIIHDPVSVHLKSMTSTLHVSSNSSPSQCYPNPRKVDVAMETLWLKNRHKEEFHIQNKGIIDTVNLEIEARCGMSKKNLFQLSIQLQASSLKFSHLKEKLHSRLTQNDCGKLGRYFSLPPDQVQTITTSPLYSTNLLLTLEERGDIHPSNVNRLTDALTELNINQAKLLTETYMKLRDNLPSNPLQMELWINKDGGVLELPDTGVSLEIPPGALEKDQLIQMRIIPYDLQGDSDLSFTSYSSVVVELLPSDLKLLKLAKLTLPHCLVLRKECEWKAKIYSSHHEKGTQPLWRPQPDTPYVLTERNCVIKLNNFSWEKFDIGDEIVEGKRIVLYAAKDLSSSQSITLIHVGYYLELPGGEKVVSINEVSVLVKKSAVYFKHGKLPLTCHFDKIEPHVWTHGSEEENPKEISFLRVVTSMGLYCTFVLHIKEGTQERHNCACYFKAGQGSELVKLLFILKDGEKDSAASSSDKLVVAGLSQLQKKTCDESITAKQLPENIDLQVRESILRDLSGKIPNKWKDVGRNLGLKNPELSIIQINDSPDHKETVYRMLETWKESKGRGATYRELGKALDKACRRDLQEWLYDQATIQDENL